jgi:hypothetical protein
MRAAGHILESVSKPVAGGRERGRPAGRGAPPTYKRFWREHPVGLFADRTACGF